MTGMGMGAEQLGGAGAGMTAAPGGGYQPAGGVGAGAGAGGGGGMGGMMGGMGNVDLTFGQGKVWAEKVGREMELLKALLSHPLQGVQVNSGQSMPQAPVAQWNPVMVGNLLRSFRGA